MQTHGPASQIKADFLCAQYLWYVPHDVFVPQNKFFSVLLVVVEDPSFLCSVTGLSLLVEQSRKLQAPKFSLLNEASPNCLPRYLFPPDCFGKALGTEQNRPASFNKDNQAEFGAGST